jgi:hypothetical protein
MSLFGGGGDDSGGPTRKTHIKRIYKNDDPDTGLWVDIERIDELTYTSGTGFAQQEKVWTFDWSGWDPNGDGVTKKKIQDPNDDTNPNDPAAAVIEVPVRDQLVVTQGAKEQYQQYTHFFANDATNSSRETHSRRVYHYDVPDDQLDDNKNPPRDPQEYLNALGDKDDSQYLEVEVLDAFTSNENENRDSHGRLKPSAWQEKRWLVNNTDALLQDRDGDTSKDFATKNPADGIIDPPWRLDPLQNIVNIGLGTEYRIVVAAFGLDSPQAVIAYSLTKTTGQKIPVPDFSKTVEVPTFTQPKYPPPGPPIATSGDVVFVAVPQFEGMDYRGYSQWETTDFTSYANAAPTGTKLYFNYKGEEIAKIPDQKNKKGQIIASDDEGTVYMQQQTRAGTTITGGLTKYDKDGKKLWTITDGTDTANYDKENNNIIVADISAGEVRTYGLDGGLQDTIDVVGGGDVSKGGKLYGLTDATDTNWGDVVGMDRKGKVTWTISGAPIDGGIGYIALTAMGETYVIAIGYARTSSSSFDFDPDTGRGTTTQTTTEVYSTVVFNAASGSQISSTPWGENNTTFETIVGPDGRSGNESQTSYGTLGSIIRSEYYPRPSS